MQNLFLGLQKKKFKALQNLFLGMQIYFLGCVFFNLGMQNLFSDMQKIVTLKESIERLKKNPHQSMPLRIFKSYYTDILFSSMKNFTRPL
jgi:hypothetical protein